MSEAVAHAHAQRVLHRDLKPSNILIDPFDQPRVTDFGPQVQQIIISLSDRAVVFGATEPDVTQFFEAYRLEDGACIWEIY